MEEFTPGFVAVAGLQVTVVVTVVATLIRDHLRKRRRQRRLLEDAPSDD